MVGPAKWLAHKQANKRQGVFETLGQCSPFTQTSCITLKNVWPSLPNRKASSSPVASVNFNLTQYSQPQLSSPADEL